jgi:hypothetical protein
MNDTGGPADRCQRCVEGSSPRAISGEDSEPLLGVLHETLRTEG